MPYYQDMSVLFSCEDLSPGESVTVRFTEADGSPNAKHFIFTMFPLKFSPTVGFIAANNDDTGAMPMSYIEWDWSSFAFAIPSSSDTPTVPVSFMAYFWKSSAVKQIGMVLDGSGTVSVQFNRQKQVLTDGVSRVFNWY
jgi:hypothetical protein